MELADTGFRWKQIEMMAYTLNLQCICAQSKQKSRQIQFAIDVEKCAIFAIASIF